MWARPRDSSTVKGPPRTTVTPRAAASASDTGANAPLAMLPQYVNHLRQYQAIALDVGNRDSLIDDNKALHEALNRFGIAHTFEVYDGDHGSGVVSRLETKVLPYFSRHLQF